MRKLLWLAIALLCPCLTSATVLFTQNYTYNGHFYQAGEIYNLGSAAESAVIAAGAAISYPTGGQSSCAIPPLVTGDYLTNDGATCSWGAVTASASSITPGTTTILGATAPCFIENTTGTTMGCVAVSGTPGGSSGQLQYNNAGSFGGFALGGDCTFSEPNITCTKTSGTAFGTFATQNYATPPAIGGTTPAAGAFTTLSANSTVSGSGFSTYLASPPAIGGTAAAAGSFTTLGASGNFTSNITGSTQCVHANSSGVLSGTGSDCGSGSAGVSSAAAGQGIAISGTGSGPYTGAITISSTSPNRTVTTSPTVASTDMGGQIVANVSGGGTLTIPAISSTVFASGMTLSIVNYSASTMAVSTTPTVNSGGGCVSGTGIPTGDSWQITSNGTTLDCIQTINGSGVTRTIASGTAALGTSAISSGTCATAVTVSAPGVATTDTINAGFNGDPTAVTGYTPSASGMLTIISYPTANNVNFKVCDNTTGSITPGPITLNWHVLR